MYDEVSASLRDAYDRSADDLERSSVAPWKQEERHGFRGGMAGRLA